MHLEASSRREEGHRDMSMECERLTRPTRAMTHEAHESHALLMRPTRAMAHEAHERHDLGL